ncbi:MAG: hypothetical protein V1725_06920 [archaeon]
MATRTEKSIVAAVATMGVCGLAGLVGGWYVGDALNDYVTVLKEAPGAIHYAVDIGCSLVGGSVGIGVG